MKNDKKQDRSAIVRRLFGWIGFAFLAAICATMARVLYWAIKEFCRLVSWEQIGSVGIVIALLATALLVAVVLTKEIIE